MLLSICLYYTLQGCPHVNMPIFPRWTSVYAYIGVLSLLLCVCVCVCVYIYITVLQKCLNQHAYIWASKNAPLCPYNRVFKDTSLHMPKLSIPYMPQSISLCGSKKIPLSLCQYPNLKNCFSIHAYIIVSKIAPYSMLLLGYLKMTPVSGSPKILLNIYICLD